MEEIDIEYLLQRIDLIRLGGQVLACTQELRTEYDLPFDAMFDMHVEILCKILLLLSVQTRYGGREITVRRGVRRRVGTDIIMHLQRYVQQFRDSLSMVVRTYERYAAEPYFNEELMSRFEAESAYFQTALQYRIQRVLEQNLPWEIQFE